MPTPVTTEHSAKPASKAMPLILGLLLGVIATLLIAFALMRAESGPLERLWSAITGRNTRIASHPPVVERIQQLQRLETVIYTMDRIVSGEKHNPILPHSLTLTPFF